MRDTVQRMGIVVAAVLLGGCHLIFGLDEVQQLADGPAADRDGATDVRDARLLVDQVPDGARESLCSALAGTVVPVQPGLAGQLVNEETGEQVGTIEIGSDPDLTRNLQVVAVDEQAFGCPGWALEFPAEPVLSGSLACCGSEFLQTNYAWLHDPRYQLTQGSVDFWFRPDADTLASHPSQGLVSRDACGTGSPGHLSIAVFRDGDGATRIGVRLQGRTVERAELRCVCGGVEDSCELCSIPLDSGSLASWHHVGLSFGGGPLALFIDGNPALDEGMAGQEGGLGCCASATTIQTQMTFGIEGNAQPWALGALEWDSCESVAPPQVTEPLRGGSLARFRVSSVRRDFAALYGAIPR